MIRRPLVFIGTLGLQPQVITLALDQLLPQNRFDEICVIHTADVPNPDDTESKFPTMREAVRRLDDEFFRRRELAGGPDEWVWEAEYRAENPRRSLLYRRVLIRRQETLAGQSSVYHPVHDVETSENSRATLRTIYRVAKEYKEQRAIVHLSIAGGRKSMSVFGMAAAQLLFEPGDRVWHIVSREEFVQTRAMHDRQDQSRLVPIRFVYLNAVAPVVGRLVSRNDPFDAIDAQEEFLQLIDLRRKERFLRTLNHDEYQILVGLSQGLTNQEIGSRLSKRLAERTVANKLTEIYELYLDSLDAVGALEDRPSGDRIRTFMAVEFGPYFQQRGEILKPD